MMQKDLVQANGTSNVPTQYESQSQVIDASDILIPRLLLMQGLSEFVAKGKAKMGDIVKSTTGEVLKDAMIIPLSYDKTWIVTEKVDGQYEFRRVEPFTFENAHLPWEFKENGNDWKRTMSLNFYCLLPSDIKKDADARAAFAKTGVFPQTSDSLLPVSISFRSTSYVAGKTLTTHFAKAKSFPVPPYVSQFKLTSEVGTNGKKTYAMYKVSEGGATPKEYLDVCKGWHATVLRQAPKVAEDDVAASAAASDEQIPF